MTRFDCTRRLLISIAMVLPISVNAPVAVATTGATVEHTVEIRNMSFQPAELEVRAGDTVTWMNRDFVPHNVSPDDVGLRSPDLIKGEMFSLVVDTGFSYVCTLHRASMAGAITVVDGN